jgi:hypothetical protein
MPLKAITIEIGLPSIGKISGEWAPDQKERDAAWELYIELITRISIVEVKPNEGLLREALTSLHSLFPTTREILRKYGPAIAKPKGKNTISFGLLSVAVLNTVIRPVLSKWHPLLADFENAKPVGISSLEYETKWEKAQVLRQILRETRVKLTEVADILADVAGVPSLLSQISESDR